MNTVSFVMIYIFTCIGITATIMAIAMGLSTVWKKYIWKGGKAHYKKDKYLKEAEKWLSTWGA